MMMDKFRYTCFLFSCQLCILSTPHSHLFYSQFINDKFLYDHSVAMEMLVQCGLKEQLLELAKVDLHPAYRQEPLTIIVYYNVCEYTGQIVHFKLTLKLKVNVEHCGVSVSEVATHRRALSSQDQPKCTDRCVYEPCRQKSTLNITVWGSLTLAQL